MYTYHDFFGTFIILNIRAVQSIQKQYGPPCRLSNPTIDLLEMPSYPRPMGESLYHLVRIDIKQEEIYSLPPSSPECLRIVFSLLNIGKDSWI